ncbi:transglutaminaseTgpA domain-containing protein [Saccharothrix lopnurensis]|uniref:TransglutaminaseTgpA domain-containing protein n=1 Tax=Saccharothrix lopnurensis TaxID=1670621 RepID=A0ABW1P679_9PSEU
MTARWGWSALLLVVAALHLGAGWQGLAPSLVFAGAAVAAFLCLPLLRWRRAPTGLVVFALLMTGVVVAHQVARDPAADPADPLPVLLDLVPRLLTAARPAPATPELLAPGALLVFAVSLLVVLALLRGGRSLLAPVVGAALLYTCAALLTAGRADRAGLVAVALVALTALGWLVVDRLETGGRVLLGLPAVPVAAVAVLALALPPDDAFEPRELVEPPVSPLGVANPLPQLASWAGLGDTELFRVRGPERAVRLVVLSDYSGATWQAASLYGPLGAVAAPDLPPGARVVEEEVQVTIGELRGSWLPTAGRPTSVTLDGAVVDPDSGSLVLPAELRPGLTYRVRGVLDVPDDDDLLDAGVPDDGRARRYLALPGLPYSLAEYARQVVRNARTPYERAVAIEQVVKQGRAPDAQAPVGSSYARLERFLFGAPGEPGAGAGTAEQFASAFAVLGRAVGLPTRVVVGFQPGAGEERAVLGGDATAWPEVYFTGWGWVPFDPVSGVSSGGSSAAQKREVLDRLASITASPTSTPLSAPPLVTPSGAVEGRAASGLVPSRRWVGYAVLAAVPLVLVSGLVLARLVRRWRLRRAGVVGAWAYVLDALLLVGRTPPPHRTAPGVARDIARDVARDGDGGVAGESGSAGSGSAGLGSAGLGSAGLGSAGLGSAGLGSAAVELARLADWAAFAPEGVGESGKAVGPAGARAGGGSAEAAVRAWRLAREVRRGLRGRVRWYRRVFWAVDPRPLWRR